ncbi:MAG: DinB family protein [Acidobacteria bacterium]|nr:DinB family protein [Acidobacteriota bacterium]
MKALTTVVLAGALMAGEGTGAQVFAPSSNPVVDAVRAVLERDSKNLIDSAALMPADRYEYRPTPAQMTFGQLMAHVAQTNVALCSALTSLPAPMGPERLGTLNQILTKEPLTPLLRQSFDYCKSALGELKDASLGEEAALFGRPTGMSRGGVLVTIATDWADHYSTAAGYLRLNGLLPPSARPAAGR